MKSKLFNTKGTETGSIDLPNQFNEKVNQDLIKRAVLVVQASKRQPHGASPKAGTRSSASLSKRRRKYRGSYGHGISRVPRKIMWRRGTQFGWEGAFISGVRGGRRAHPLKAEKDLILKINQKERRKAIRSALAATINPELVEIKHKMPKNYPLVLESDFEKLSKTKQVKDLLLKLDLEKELERISPRKIRAGKGKNRGRKYKLKRGPLIIVSKDCPLEKAASNLQGIDITQVQNLNTEILAPGTIPGRLILWSKDAITRLGEEKLFTNSPISKKLKIIDEKTPSKK